MKAYKFYRGDEVRGYELLGVLPERRKNSARITWKTVLGWADKLFCSKSSSQSIHFTQVTINENTGMIFRPTPASSEDVGERLGEVQKEPSGFDELMERTSQSLQVDRIKCISCGSERSEHEMQKVFYKKYKGICKTCFESETEA